jgi:hypothetical protein
MSRPLTAEYKKTTIFKGFNVRFQRVAFQLRSENAKAESQLLGIS